MLRLSEVEVVTGDPELVRAVFVRELLLRGESLVLEQVGSDSLPIEGFVMEGRDKAASFGSCVRVRRSSLTGTIRGGGA